MQRSINIISGQIPCPITLGDAQQTYWLIEGLSAVDIQVNLYTFGAVNEILHPTLFKLCSSVKVYPLNIGHRNFSFTLPYASAKYQNAALLSDLAQNKYPILIEGTGPCGAAFSKTFAGREIWVRLLTYAPSYFRYLVERAKDPFKKLYYKREAALSSSVIKKIRPEVKWLVQSDTDKAILQTAVLGGHIKTLAPLSSQASAIESKPGLGSYCLFHGNLADAATHQTAVWLLTHVFHNLNVPFVITGNDPDPSLIALAHKKPHTCIVANPAILELRDMIQKAQIIIQPSFVHTGPGEALIEGIKLGRHCITNVKKTKNSFAACYHQGASANAFQEIIVQLYHFPFSDEEIDTRKKALAHEKSNTEIVKEFTAIIWR